MDRTIKDMHTTDRGPGPVMRHTAEGQVASRGRWTAVGLALLVGLGLLSIASLPIRIGEGTPGGGAAETQSTARPPVTAPPRAVPNASTVGVAVLRYLDRPEPALRMRAEKSINELGARHARTGPHTRQADAVRHDYLALARELMDRQDRLHARLASVMAAIARLDALLGPEAARGDRGAVAAALRLHEVGELLGYYLRAQDGASLARLDLARRGLVAAVQTGSDSRWAAAADGLAAPVLEEINEIAALATARARDLPRLIALSEELDHLLGADTPPAPAASGMWSTALAIPEAHAATVIVLGGMLVLGALALFGSLLVRRSIRRGVHSQLRELTEQDPLTGLTSRAGFTKRLDVALKMARRRGGKLALLLLDLDRFKDINDSLGHDQGDRLLQAIGRRLRSEVREVDIVARLGGDEFCLLLTDIPDDMRSAEVAQRCLEALSRPIDVGPITIRPRASIGIALHPLDGGVPQDLLKAADTAMYAAKHAGGHRYSFYEARMTAESERQLAMESALRAALERGQLTLEYQPKVDLATGGMRGAEALLRWRHPERGPVPPDEFIPMAERMGLIGEIGEWVLRQACRQALAWQRSGLSCVAVAVNISPGHFEANGFVDSVAAILEECGLEPRYLEIEVTESVTRDPRRHMAISRALQELGVRVAIDDFGTGYSSLSVLKHMPVDALKLDRQFVGQMLEDAQSAVLVGAIIGMARGLNLEIVAEGVETMEQALVLRGLGCSMAQGYLFSRPVKPELIPELARSSFLAASIEQPAPETARLAAGVH